MVAEAFGGFAKDRRAVRLLLWRRGVLARARIFKDIAAGNLLAFYVAGLAASAEQVLEAVEMRFELRRGDAPVLYGHISRNKILAVARDRAAALLEIIVLEAKRLAVP